MRDQPKKELLHALFYYDKNGFFRYKFDMPKRNKKDEIVGEKKESRIKKRMYVIGKIYPISLCVWIYHNDEIKDSQEVGHINNNPSDNRIDNLYIADRSVICGNSKKRSTNKSGRIGVCFHKKTMKWRATIVKNKKQYSLGVHSFFEDAVKAREEAEEKFGYNISSKEC